MIEENISCSGSLADKRHGRGYQAIGKGSATSPQNRMTAGKEGAFSLRSLRLAWQLRQRLKVCNVLIPLTFLLVILVFLLEPYKLEKASSSQRGFLLEEELHVDGNVSDPLLSANASMSHICLPCLNDRERWEIGEEIRVAIVLFDGYGNPKTRGGDHVRIRIHEAKYQAAAAGHVIDHDNGSYTGVVTALWTGNPVIEVALFYSREVIRTVYSLRRRIPGTRIITAMFQRGPMKEVTPCYPFPFSSGSTASLCDLTAFNSGMSWFCGKPKNKQLSCSDWSAIKSYKPNLPLSPVEETILSPENVGLYISAPISVEIVPSNSAQLYYTSERNCSNIDRSSLWLQTSPNGFFYNNTWHTRSCHANRRLEDIQLCLSKADVYMLGDSIMRDFYKELVRIVQCEHEDPGWSAKPFYKPETCSNPAFNYTLHWHAHSMPITVSVDWESNRFTTKSIVSHLDQIKGDSKAIFVIHLYSHFLVFSTDVFINRVRKIRDSVKHLLKRNKNAVVAIKGPHSFRLTPLGGAERQCDYFSYVYRDIMAREFYSLRHSVIYVDQMDMTIALDQKNNHPRSAIVSESVYNVLSYVCDSSTSTRSY